MSRRSAGSLVALFVAAPFLAVGISLFLLEMTGKLGDPETRVRAAVFSFLPLALLEFVVIAGYLRWRKSGSDQVRKS